MYYASLERYWFLDYVSGRFWANRYLLKWFQSALNQKNVIAPLYAAIFLSFFVSGTSDLIFPMAAAGLKLVFKQIKNGSWPPRHFEIFHILYFEAKSNVEGGVVGGVGGKPHRLSIQPCINLWGWDVPFGENIRCRKSIFSKNENFFNFVEVNFFTPADQIVLIFWGS